MMSARDILRKAPVVPVVVLDELDHAIPLAKALVAGGIPVIEVTLRTEVGLEAIRRIKGEVEGAIVGAGTVLSADDLRAALAVGSEFIITPGLTPSLLDAGTDCGVPFMPGTASVSDIMCCLEKGLDTLKFFPAEALGGVKTLQAFSGPFPDIRFCPTGGISKTNLASYLTLDSVLSVGGSWLADRKMMQNGDWEGISQLAEGVCKQVASL